MRAIHLAELVVREFRNLKELRFVPSPTLTVIVGDNGHGKTNLLEAIYVAATTRSFRASKLVEMVAHGGARATVHAKVALDDEQWTQAVAISAGSRVALLDSKKPSSLAAYATRSPVVLFHPDSVQLSTGSGGERRRLLDRVALFFDHTHLQALADYTQALRSRQRLLELSGARAPSLSDWEALMVDHGLRVQRTRERAAGYLREAIRTHFRALLPAELEFDIAYEATAPLEASAFRERLELSRNVDLHRRRPSIGPQRDDLTLRFGERAMRPIASQGQHRAAVLSLKLAELMTITELRGAMPAVLLDDFSSELDPTRTDTLLALLQAAAAQVILTTASPDIATLVKRRYREEAAVCRMTTGTLGPPE